MRILVQKFGGSSLSTAQAREHAIRHIREALRQEYRLVVVVSAMGRKGEPYATDTLLDFLASEGGYVEDREKDMLLCCGEIISAVTLCGMLNERSIRAAALTGGQAGIMTTGEYGDARITSIDPSRIVELLEREYVVVVTGFQGKTGRDELTTLGRGGSDTSATAIAAALGAEVVDIFTDVNGILTADPRIVEDAKPLSNVTYAEMCNMAHHGAKVIHPRAVELAMQARIPIRVRSTFSDSEGTLVTSADKVLSFQPLEDRHVTGIAYVDGVTQIQIADSEGRYDLQLQIFKAMARNRISVDFINVNPAGVVYTVFDREAERAVGILKQLGFQPKHVPGCAKVSVIGGGMNGVPGIMARIVEALTEEDVRIMQSADSNTTIWVLVRSSDMAKAVRALHRQFRLYELPRGS